MHSSYERSIRSAIAEQILNKSSVYLQNSLLKIPFLMKVQSKSVDKNSEFYKFYKLSTNNTLISTEYYSRDKRTFRIFTKSGYPNFITLHDPHIMKAMKSRHPLGKIVMIDYSVFEFTIIGNILGIKDFPEDIHSYTANEFGCERSDAKRINGVLFYGNEESIGNMLEHTDGLTTEFGTFVMDIRERINQYVDTLSEVYTQGGWVLNSYGRKIYPKNEDSIFNNVIQSIGSEILIESLIELYKYTKDKPIDIMFHRFDSLFFDCSKEGIEDIEGVKHIMENINPDIPLKTTVHVGNTVHTLKGK
jgi:hypothetical protein